MAANACPECRKAVMTYGRFLREAEPYRVSACGSCGAKLRRSPMVYVLLLVMGVLLGLGAVGLSGAVMKGQLSNARGAGLGVILVLAWTFLTNYLGYRLVGWLPAKT